MVHFLNILSFVMELVFGRDASVRRTRGQSFKLMLFFTLLAVSMYSNYYQFSTRYEATARYLALQEKMKEFDKLKRREIELESEVKTLKNVLTVISSMVSDKDLDEVERKHRQQYLTTPDKPDQPDKPKQGQPPMIEPNQPPRGPRK